MGAGGVMCSGFLMMLLGVLVMFGSLEMMLMRRMGAGSLFSCVLFFCRWFRHGISSKTEN